MLREQPKKWQKDKKKKKKKEICHQKCELGVSDVVQWVKNLT